jgi:hypothetical protein
VVIRVETKESDRVESISLNLTSNPNPFLNLNRNPGEDGQQFVFHCLSIALSLSGASLWHQLGWPLFQVNGINMMNDVLSQDGWFKYRAKPYVWMDLENCTKIVKLVLVRALKSQVGVGVRVYKD